MTKIVTVTANTAIDWVIDAENWSLGDNVVAKSAFEFACGKGINVAKTVTATGIPACCLGFVGQDSTGIFDSIKSTLLAMDLIAVPGKTRVNITLNDNVNHRELHIRTPGYRLSIANPIELAEKIERLVDAGDIVVFSGSLPEEAPTNFYRDLINLCRARNARTVLDANGDGLEEGIKAAPDIVKPNLAELEALAKQPLSSLEETIAFARTLIAQGVAKVCVSLGENGVLAVDSATVWTLRCQAPPKIHSQIGCGDALVAGLACGLQQAWAWEDCLKWGVACATANLSSFEPGRIDVTIASEYLDQVEIKRIA